MNDDRNDLLESEDPRLDAAVRGAYCASQPHAPDAEARLLERLTRRRASGIRWWLDAQWFELRPAVALALAALTLAAGVWAGMRLGSPAGRTATLRRVAPPVQAARTAAAPEGVPVTFVLRAPGATSVCVAGDFNNWDAAATPMTHTGTGDMWIVSVEIPRGVHLYSFVLDGREWRPDPSAPLAAGDAFGGRNSVVVVNGAGPL
jgi:hypothetical protein